MVADSQLQLDLDGSHTLDLEFGDWVKSLPPTPWADEDGDDG